MSDSRRFSEYRIFRYLKPHLGLVAITIVVSTIFTIATGYIGYQTKFVVQALEGDPVVKKVDKLLEKNGIGKKRRNQVRKALERTLPEAQLAQRSIIAKAMEEAGIDDVDIVANVTGALKMATMPKAKWAMLKKVSVTIAALAIVIAASVFGRMYLKRYIAYKIDYELRNDLCRHLLGMSMEFFHDKRSGELLSNMTNDIYSANMALLTVFDCVLVPIQLGSLVVFSFVLNPVLAAIMVLLMPIIALPTWQYRKKIRRASAGRMSKLADLTQGMTQLLTGIRTVKSFRMEEQEAEDFAKIGRGVLRKSMKTTRAKGASTAFTTFLSRFGAAAVTLGIGYLIIFPGLFTQLGVRPLELEDVIPFLGFTALAYKAIKTGARDYANLQEFLPGSERLFMVFDAAPKILDQPNAVPLSGVTQSIVFRDVEFAYDHVPVLEAITLEIKAGSVVAIVGHSGAGKSTLLDLIPRFYDPQKGSVEIDGHDVRQVTRDSLLANIAIVGQEPFLFNTTIADNIRYGRQGATLEQIIEAAKAANIHEFVDSQPEGYDTIVGDQGVKLSGGQRQRLTIARAILKDAPILILDEATSSLDNESEKLVQAALQNLMKGRTTFVIAHRLSTVQHADRIVVLKDGRVAEDGTHDELLAAGGEYARLYQSEF